MILTMQVVLTLVGFFVFSAGVGAMSPPSDAQKTRFYGWLYRFLQRLAANADRLAEAKFGSLAGAGTVETLASSTSESRTLTVAAGDTTAAK